MIYCVFLDPEAIRALPKQGNLGSDALIGILRILLTHCLLAETTDWNFGQELRDAIKSIEDQNTRMRLSALVEAFHKRNRFVDILESGNQQETPLQTALRNQTHQHLDAIITVDSHPTNSIGAEVIQVENFHRSYFAARCHQEPCLNLDKDTIHSTEFFKKYLSRLLLVTGSVKFYDSVIGKDFGDNFFHNLPFWISFLQQATQQVELTIHTEGSKTQNILLRLNELTEDTNISPSVVRHEPDTLPHERYLRTVAFTLNLGRGIDLFHPHTGMNRDLHMAIVAKVKLPDHPTT
jgi:hypothetical protein